MITKNQENQMISSLDSEYKKIMGEEKPERRRKRKWSGYDK
jgi:hypothetical protein